MNEIEKAESWGSWAENEESFLLRARNTTAYERLKWLDEMLTLLAPTGAIQRTRALENELGSRH